MPVVKGSSSIVVLVHVDTVTIGQGHSYPEW